MTTAVLTFGRRIGTGDSRAWRQAMGWSISFLGLVLLGMQGMHMLATWLAGQPAVRTALLATAGTALATGLGALPVLFFRRISSRLNDSLMGFGAGVMLSAAVFSLLLPAMETARTVQASAVNASLLVGLALVAGAMSLLLMDRLLPHQHFVSGSRGMPVSATWQQRDRGLWLFVLAIALHNLPEGLAVGVAVAGDSNAAALTLGMAVQNLPEGLVVALAMQALGWKALPAVLVALGTGFVEPVGGLLGATLVASSSQVMPLALAFAAGAMLFVVSHEIIPESHRNGHETDATLGLVAGFVVMMVLDTALA